VTRVDSLSEQFGSNTAVAVKAGAGGASFTSSSIGAGHLAGSPAVGAVRYPALLPIGRSNPNTGLLACVVNEQSPFCVELSDFAVLDGFGSERVDHNNFIEVENQLGLKPNQVAQDSNCCTNQSGNYNVVLFGRVEENLNQEQGVQENGAPTPDQIGFGAEDGLSVHESIFASDAVDVEKDTK